MKLTLQPNRRRIRLVDDVLQKWMLVALVVMEAVVVALAIWALYRALGAIVDANMYRIHFADGDSMWPQLVSEGMRVLGGMLLINVAALIIADRIWAYYVYGILRHLGRLMDATGNLDFSDHHPIFFHHAVLDQAFSWRRMEAAHLGSVRARVGLLPAQLPAPAQERAALAALLARLGDG